MLARLITPALEALQVDCMGKRIRIKDTGTATRVLHETTRGGRPHGPKSSHLKAKGTVPVILRTGTGSQTRNCFTHRKVVRGVWWSSCSCENESGLEGVRTRSGQDDGTAGDLGRVLLHDGRGVLDGEEAAVRSRKRSGTNRHGQKGGISSLPADGGKASDLGARTPAKEVDAHLKTLTRMTSITPSSSRCSSVMFRPVVPALAKKKSRRPFSENACSQTERIRAESAASPVKEVTCQTRVGEWTGSAESHEDLWKDQNRTTDLETFVFLLELLCERIERRPIKVEDVDRLGACGMCESVSGRTLVRMSSMWGCSPSRASKRTVARLF